MSIFGNLFGTKEVVDNLVDKDSGLLAQVGGWIGNMEYTDEERAKANAATREWGIRQLSALEPFKVVQRILAFSIMGMWLIVGFNVLAAIWVQDAVIKADMLTFAFSDYVLYPAMIVLSLYFGGGVVDSLKRKILK